MKKENYLNAGYSYTWNHTMFTYFSNSWLQILAFSAANAEISVSKLFRGTSPWRGKRNEDEFITRQHMVVCDQVCSAFFHYSYSVRCISLFPCCRQVSWCGSCSMFAHLRNRNRCKQGHPWSSAKGRVLESCLLDILHCKIWCLMPS